MPASSACRDTKATAITLHDLFAGKIRRDAKEGVLYPVYGFHRVLPSYLGMDVLIPDVAG